MASIGQPNELILQIIVGLFPQTVLTNEWQFRETLEHTQVHTHHHLTQNDTFKSGAKEANRPDVFIGGSQQLHDQVNLLDLRSTGQQRFVSQQLSQDAANSPAELTSH